LNGVLIPHIDQIEVAPNRHSEGDDETAPALGRIREMVQKALKIISENSFFYKDLEVRKKLCKLTISIVYFLVSWSDYN